VSHATGDQARASLGSDKDGRARADVSDLGAELPADPELPLLGRALDPSEMASRFADHFRSRGGWDVERCTIEKVYYHSRRHCEVCYRVLFRSPAGATAEEWVSGRLLAPDIARARYANGSARGGASAANAPPLGRSRSLDFWEDWNMTIAVFPFDRKMAHLSTAADPRWVAETLERHRSALPWTIDAPLDETAIELGRIKYMPGKRCVMRCRIESAASASVSFFSKTYGDARSAHHHEVLLSACEQLEAQGSSLHLPRPLIHLPEAHTTWTEDWGGRPLMSALDDGDRLTPMRRAAATVAALHSSRIDGLAPGEDVKRVLLKVAEDTHQHANAFPEHRTLTNRIRRALEETAGRVFAEAAPRVPIHGACRIEQMITRGDEITLVDFDALASGDPHEDVAELIASLRFLEIGAGRSRAELEHESRVFLEAYESLVPWRCRRDRIAWYVLAYLTAKMYSVCKHLDQGSLRRLRLQGESLATECLEALE
jgi:hypothetical protein